MISMTVTSRRLKPMNQTSQFTHSFKLSVAVLVLWFFWDTLLGVTLHGLHIVVEILELGLEHLLESLFHVEGHTAQMYTAWIGFSLLVALTLFAYRHTRRMLANKFPTKDHFSTWSRQWAREHWFILALPTLVLVLSESLF
jgi:hypothetical protein